MISCSAFSRGVSPLLMASVYSAMRSAAWRAGGLEVARRDNLIASAGDQPGEDPDVDAAPDELHRSVREQTVGPARVKAVDLPVIVAAGRQAAEVVGAVDGAGP